MISVQMRRIVCSWSRTRRGVNPRLTSFRRRLCSSPSIEMIIGRWSPWGRGARWLEKVFASFSTARTSSYRVRAQISFFSSQ